MAPSCCSGGLWGWRNVPWPLRLWGLMLLGWGLAFSFCAMHECAHRTAFLNRQRNDTSPDGLAC
ncbi:MAG: hypothetical protein ACKOOH_06285 [Cyanobium sp.]